MTKKALASHTNLRLTMDLRHLFNVFLILFQKIFCLVSCTAERANHNSFFRRNN